MKHEAELTEVKEREEKTDELSSFAALHASPLPKDWVLKGKPEDLRPLNSQLALGFEKKTTVDNKEAITRIAFARVNEEGDAPGKRPIALFVESGKVMEFKNKVDRSSPSYCTYGGDPFQYDVTAHKISTMHLYAIEILFDFFVQFKILTPAEKKFFLMLCPYKRLPEITQANLADLKTALLKGDVDTAFTLAKASCTATNDAYPLWVLGENLLQSILLNQAYEAFNSIPKDSIYYHNAQLKLTELAMSLSASELRQDQNSGKNLQNMSEKGISHLMNSQSPSHGLATEPNNSSNDSRLFLHFVELHSNSDSLFDETHENGSLKDPNFFIQVILRMSDEIRTLKGNLKKDKKEEMETLQAPAPIVFSTTSSASSENSALDASSKTEKPLPLK